MVTGQLAREFLCVLHNKVAEDAGLVSRQWSRGKKRLLETKEETVLLEDWKAMDERLITSR